MHDASSTYRSMNSKNPDISDPSHPAKCRQSLPPTSERIKNVLLSTCLNRIGKWPQNRQEPGKCRHETARLREGLNEAHCRATLHCNFAAERIFRGKRRPYNSYRPTKPWARDGISGRGDIWPVFYSHVAEGRCLRSGYG